MAEIQQSNVVGNYLSSYRDAQQNQQQQQDRQTMLGRQNTLQQRQDVTYDQSQKDRAFDQVGPLIANLQDGDAQGLESVRSAARAVGVPDEILSTFDVQHIPQMREIAKQKLAEKNAPMVQQQFTNNLATQKLDLDRQSTAASIRASDAAAAAAKANAEYIRSGKGRGPGQAPLMAGDKKAIRDAEEHITGSQSAVSMLQQALKLNSDTLQGPGAETLGNIGGLFGDQTGINTSDLSNLVESQILPQLKAIFGGMPTEGERAILLKVAGAVSQPRQVRERIFNRAIEIANSRIARDSSMVNDMRGGTYYSPGRTIANGYIDATGAAAPQAAPGAAATAPTQRRAVPPPPPGFKVIQP